MEMPPKVDGCPWVLKYSTSKDGFTLNSMTRKLSSVTGPVLILIQVTSENASYLNILDIILEKNITLSNVN